MGREIIKLRKVIHKWFWVWDFDKEEKWLNELAAKGLALTSVGFCRYEFEDCVPGEYKICLEFLENRASSKVEKEKYIEFLEETGAEHVGTVYNFVYFRKRTTEEDFRLFSDNTSRIKHLTRIIGFIAFLGGINLYLGCYNLLMYYYWHNPLNMIGIVSLLVAVLCIIGLTRLSLKRKRLKSEQQIFE